MTPMATDTCDNAEIRTWSGRLVSVIVDGKRYRVVNPHAATPGRRITFRLNPNGTATVEPAD